MRFKIREVANGFVIKATMRCFGYDHDNDRQEVFFVNFEKALKWIQRYGQKELKTRAKIARENG